MEFYQIVLVSLFLLATMYIPILDIVGGVVAMVITFFTKNFFFMGFLVDAITVFIKYLAVHYLFVVYLKYEINDGIVIFIYSIIYIFTFLLPRYKSKKALGEFVGVESAKGGICGALLSSITILSACLF